MHGSCSPALERESRYVRHLPCRLARSGDKAMSGLSDEIEGDVDQTVTSVWESRDGTVVPNSDAIALGNDRVVLDAVLLYADLADSTEMAIGNQEIASEVFKSYLSGVTKIIRDNGGHIRSFDGDRVMAVFIGDVKATSAVRTGLQINWFFQNVLTKKFRDYYDSRIASFNFDQTVGIDKSHVHVARAGIRRNNDLIWVGRAPNIAAKLSSIRNESYKTFITPSVYNTMLKSSRFGKNGLDMWTELNWDAGDTYGIPQVYGSGWWWPL